MGENCRICCQNEGVYCMFQKEASDLQISAKIKYCCPKINIEEGDGLPSRVCEECKGELEVAYQFVIKCESADENLRSLICVTDNQEAKIEVNSENDDDSNLDREDEVSLINNYESKPEIEEETACPLENVEKSEEINHETKNKTCKKEVVKFKKDIINVIRNVKEYTCIYCDYKTKSFSDSVSHIKKHSKDGTYPCPKCGKKLKSPTNLHTHFETTHHNRAKRYVCEMCGKAFDRTTYLTTHIRSHTKETPYSCSLCGKNFTQKSSLIRHKEIHEGKKKYGCTVCSKSFITRDTLRRHMFQHQPPRKATHECYICKKAFILKCDLKSHIESHSDQENFICDYCGKGFNLKYKLKNHFKRFHSDKVRFCKVCSKNVKNYTKHMKKHAGVKNLKKHMNKHAGVKTLSTHIDYRDYQFKCKECNIRYPLLSKLKIHIAKEHKARFTYPCDSCSRGFYRKCDLTKHMKKEHIK